VHREERGAVLIEFAVVFPVQLFVTLGIMQLALLIVGHIVVQHAAFAAARAALVQDVPSGQGAPNPQARAEYAAAVVLAPICATNADLASGRAAVQVTRDDLTWPAQGGQFKLNRAAGAYAPVTTVTLDPGGAQDSYAAVQVRHEFALIIPVVNGFFAKAGPYALYGVNASSVQGRGIFPILPITKTGFVPRPWSR
jgi:Flp pilus assembly protein TadG